MRRIRHHRSSRRVPPPSDSDFDHEIKLVDHDEDASSAARPSLAGPSSSRREATRASGSAGALVAEEREDGGSGVLSGLGSQEEACQPSVQVEEPTPQAESSRPPLEAQPATDRGRQKSPESAVEILYENQRGGFLCGIPLFSAKALGNLDPPAWTNYAHKPSPTDIHTAQVPDPSWEWAWPEWRVNMDEGVDGDGWEYSFAFSRKFSWHKAQWWNSFVRRRAWIRKRVKKNAGYLAQDPHMLNPEYFTVRPSSELTRDRSASRASSVHGSRVSVSTARTDGAEQPVIEQADELLRVLRASRIDREKIEAVDNYLDNARDELEGLGDIMHDVMSLFVFQASRRVLLGKLAEFHDKAAAEQQKKRGGPDPESRRRLENLAAAVQHADEEVRRLEYWSDVKAITETGESKGAVDKKQGWDATWRGVDKSGPSAPPAPPSSSEHEAGKAESGDAEGQGRGKT